MKRTLPFVWFVAILAFPMLGVGLLGGDAQAQIDIRNDGGYVGRARDIIDCRGGLQCFVDAGVGFLVSPTASGGSGVTPAGLCGDGGSALGWDGGAYYCADTTKPGSCSAGQYVTAVSTSGAPTCAAVSVFRNWQTDLDCNLDADTVQTLGSDTTYTVCGGSVRKEASAGDATAMAVVAGAGLRIKPAASTDLNGTTRTAPRLHFPITHFISGLTPDTPVRFTAYFTDNIAANYDAAILGVWTTNGTTYGWFRTHLVNSTSKKLGMWRMVEDVNGTEQQTTVFGTPNVLRLTFPHGLGPAHAFNSVSTYDAGFYDDTQFKVHTSFGPGDINAFGPSAGISGYEVILSAMRAGSGTSLQVDWHRLRIEHLQ